MDLADRWVKQKHMGRCFVALEVCDNRPNVFLGDIGPGVHLTLEQMNEMNNPKVAFRYDYDHTNGGYLQSPQLPNKEYSEHVQVEFHWSPRI